jgi:hypothetical protein
LQCVDPIISLDALPLPIAGEIVLHIANTSMNYTKQVSLKASNVVISGMNEKCLLFGGSSLVSRVD